MFKTSDFFEILDYLKLRERYDIIVSDYELETGDLSTQEFIDEVSLDEDLLFLVSSLTAGVSPVPVFYWNGDIALVTQTLADNEKITATKLFENTLDQPTFSSDDYKRLRKFFVDWYAANRTMISTQKNISDLYSMPPDHMEELLKSFGYDINIDAMDQQTRAEFFKSLVAFYKKKGTIDTLTKALEFYGFIDADIIEYWLKKTDGGTSLVFSPERTRRQSGSFLIDYDMPFNVVTDDDPHWLATEQWILDQDAINKINLPSKSPYFSLVASFSIDYIKSILAVYQRVIHDQYDTWVTTTVLPDDVILRGLDITSSILEAHLAMMFVFESLHPEDHTTTDENFYIYNVNPGVPFDLQLSNTVINQYVSMITNRPTDRDDRTTKLQTIWDDWTRPLSTAMLYNTDVDTLLTSIDPDIRAACQLEIDNGNAESLLVNLISTITNWIRLNISSDAPNLIVFLLGYNFNEDITKIINFFKPYRARMVATDGTYVISDKLGDSVVLAEQNLLRIYQTITDDFDISDYVTTEITMDPFTEDHLCCLPPNYDGNTILQFDGNDNQNNPFCFDNLFATDMFFPTIIQEVHDDAMGEGGRYPLDNFEWDITASPLDSIIVTDVPTTAIESVVVSNLYIIEDNTDSSYLLDATGTDVIYAEQTHGFGNFDGGFDFDDIPSYGSDSINIYVNQLPPPIVLSGSSSHISSTMSTIFKVQNPSTYIAEVLSDSPILYWKLNETSGPTINDSSGNNNNGSAVGSFTFADNTDPFAAGCLFVDSEEVSSGYDVEISSITGFTGGGSNPFTIELLFNSSSWNPGTTFDDLLFNLGSGGFPITAGIYLKQGDRLSIIRETSTSTETVIGPLPVLDNTWYYLALVWTGSQRKVYLNDATPILTDSIGYDSMSNQKFSIFGTDIATRTFEGKEAHVAIYNSALGDADVQQRLDLLWIQPVNNIDLSVGTSGSSTSVVKSGDEIHAWGDNTYRGINPASATHPWTDTSTIMKSGVRKASVGRYHTAALLDTGEVVCWGYNVYKQSNPASATSPWTDTSTVVKSDVVQVSCGAEHTMCVLSNGDLVGWGKNVSGQVNPYYKGQSPWTDPDEVILTDVKQVECGNDFTMVLLKNGDVVGWGYNTNNRVNPASGDTYWLDPYTVLKSGVKQIAIGSTHTMCLLTNGDVIGWGRNNYKQVNPASATTPWTNTTTVFKSGVENISADDSHTMCVLTNGDVIGWGLNTSRQVNPASATSPWTNTTTVFKSGVESIRCARFHTMCLLPNGDVVGWGLNTNRQVNPISATTPWIDPATVHYNIS